MVTLKACMQHLRGVDKIYSSGYAFAAVVEVGTVVTWGHLSCGGDSRSATRHCEGLMSSIPEHLRLLQYSVVIDKCPDDFAALFPN